jgi:hypothetical protein
MPEHLNFLEVRQFLLLVYTKQIIIDSQPELIWFLKVKQFQILLKQVFFTTKEAIFFNLNLIQFLKLGHFNYKQKYSLIQNRQFFFKLN